VNEDTVLESSSQQDGDLPVGCGIRQSVATSTCTENDLALHDTSCDNVALLSSVTEGEICVPVKTLCSHEQVNKSKNTDQNVRYPPITGTIEERCVIASQHITKVVIVFDSIV